MLDLLIKITLVVLVILIGYISYLLGYAKGLKKANETLKENK